jgi:hypothetical protein
VARVQGGLAGDYEREEDGVMTNQPGIHEGNAPGQPKEPVRGVDVADLIRSMFGYRIAAGMAVVRELPFEKPPEPPTK